MTEFVTRRYTLKLYPNRAQVEALERQAMLLARLWNAALEQRETQWRLECQRRGKDERKGLTYYDQARQLKHIRAADPEYAAMSCATLELTIKALDLAFKAFWRRLKQGARGDAGYPRFKRPAMHGTIWHRDGAGWKIEPIGNRWRIYAKGIPGRIKARGRFPAEITEYRTMELIRRDGSWWISIVVRMEPRRVTASDAAERTVHFGLLDEFVRETVRDGRHAAVPETWDMVDGRIASRDRGHDCFRRHESNEDLQQAMANCQRGSNRWRELKRILARRQAREARRRRESLHHWTTQLIERSSALTAIVPDSLQGATHSGRGDAKHWGAAVETKAMVNRRVLSQAPASAVQMLAYKAAEAGIDYHEAAHTELVVGTLAVRNAKALRQTRRIIKKEQQVA